MTVSEFRKALEGLPDDLPLYVCDPEEGFCEASSVTPHTLHVREYREGGPTVIVERLDDPTESLRSFPAAIIGFGKLVELEIPE